MTSSLETSTDSVGRLGRINVVVAYEDFHAGKRAQHTCQQIIDLAHGNGVLSTDLWKFDMLKLSSMRETATEDAARADLVVLAPQDGIELPPGVMDWVRLILQQPTQPKALLALLESAPEDPALTSPVQEQIQEFAARIQLWCLRPAAADGAWLEPGYETAELEQVAREIFSTRSVTVSPPEELATSVPTDLPTDQFEPVELLG